MEILEERTLLSAPQAPASLPGLTEFLLPPGTYAYLITSGSDGNLWFTEVLSNQIGRITTSGVVTQYSLQPALFAPSNIFSRADGNLWFADDGQIFRLTPAGVFTAMPVKDSSGATINPDFIADGPDGSLWFASNSGWPLPPVVGLIDSSGTAKVYHPPLLTNFGIDGIASGPDGNLWFAEGPGNMIGKITPSGVLTEYSFLPAQIVLGGSSTVVDIIAGPDGNVWFTEPGNDLVGRITPSGNIIQYTFPSGTYPSSITAGPNGNVWFAGKAIGEITANGTVTLYASLSNTNILHITTGPDQNLWFTVQELSGNKTHIGTVVPNLLGSGQSMIVGTVQGTAFTGSVGTVTLTNPQGANASINWGDGHTTPGTLVPDGAGSFTITGTNIFQQPGNFPITISVVSPNGLHTTIKSTATVAASPYAGFVTQLYRDLLQRQPDAPGLQFWIQTLNQGTSRAQVVLDFQSSPEYRTDAVDHLYASLLGRVADPAGESGFVAFLNAGGALQQVEVAILVSPEYFQRAGGTIGGFLGAIYHDVLGRGLDPSGAMLYGQLLSMAPTLPMRSLVAGAVVGSAEANQDTVKNDYQTFLRRGVDSGGLNMFAGALDYGLPADMVLAAIVGSDEYFARFST